MDIEITLRYLLTHSDPFICLVKGQWGVGKTYFIKEFVRDNCRTITKSNFSYISLFGVSSSEELLQAIFVNSVPTNTLNAKTGGLLSTPTDESLKTRANYVFSRAKPLLNTLGNIPFRGANNMRGFVVANLANFFNRNSLIIVDDLERHSTSLSIRDILGVLTQLKEEKGCQIIIVMNEDGLLKDGSDAAYFETKEKVIDRELLFQPTIEDAIQIGLRDLQTNEEVTECCRKLAIANIRTIQKIETTIRQLRDVVTDLKVEIPESFDSQLQTTSVLAVWAYWERVIDIEDLEKMGPGDSLISLMEEVENKFTDKQRDLHARMRAYGGYGYSDDTDRMIIRFVKTGIIDREEVALRIRENDAAIEKRRLDEQMGHAWDVYRSLKPNEDEVVSALYESHVAGVEVAQTATLGQAVWVLRQLGEDQKANDLTEKFFARESPIDSYGSYPFTEMLQDQQFIERWKEATEERSDDRDIDTTIRSYYGANQRTVDDIKRLSQFTAAEFYDWFVANANDKRVLGVADALARIRHRVGGLETETAKVQDEVRSALRRFYNQGKLNRIRLRALFPAEPAKAE